MRYAQLDRLDKSMDDHEWLLRTIGALVTIGACALWVLVFFGDF